MPDRSWTAEDLAKLGLERRKELLGTRTLPKHIVAPIGSPQASANFNAIEEDIPLALMRLNNYRDPSDFMTLTQDASEAKKMLERNNKGGALDVHAMWTAPGTGAQSYKAIWDLAKELDKPAISDTLTGINRRRRTSNMMQQWLHDPGAGDYVYLDPSQNLRFEGRELRPDKFGRMSPDEQLGWLATNELDWLRNDHPSPYELFAATKPEDLFKADSPLDVAAKHFSKLQDNPWGRRSMGRARITDELLRGTDPDSLPLDLLEGIGGYAHGGRVATRHKK